MGKCPALLTELRKVDYLLHGILRSSTATSIAAQRPSSVSSFIDICTQLDRTMQHRQSAKEPHDCLEQPLHGHSNESTHARQVRPAKPPSLHSSRLSHEHQPRPASPPRSHRIADLPPAEKEARYSALSEHYGVSCLSSRTVVE